jgi:hypothetical protein
MGNRVAHGIYFLFVSFLSAGSLAAQPLGTTARQMEKGSWKMVGYYQGTHEQDLDFELAGDGICTSNVGGKSFACGQTSTVKATGNGEAAVVKWIFQPHETGLQYYLFAGAGGYRLSQGTTTVVDSGFVDHSGFLSGVGAKAVLFPDTLVSPGLALDAGAGWQRYFDDLRLDILQYQVAIEASHRFVFREDRLTVEPYGGVKWFRSLAWLRDIGSGTRVGGKKDTVTPFLGLYLPIGDSEGLFGEASFVNGIQYAMGLSILFK